MKGDVKMGKLGEEDRVTFRWIVGVLIALLMLVAGFALGETKKALDAKVDKDQYYRDLGEMKEAIKEINYKLDCMVGFPPKKGVVYIDPHPTTVMTTVLPERNK
jgi:hypothetical protein